MRGFSIKYEQKWAQQCVCHAAYFTVRRKRGVKSTANLRMSKTACSVHGIQGDYHGDGKTG